MGSSVKIKIDRDLFDRLRKAAEARGYATVEEFVAHVLEKAVADVDDGDTASAVRERLRGLGYVE